MHFWFKTKGIVYRDTGINYATHFKYDLTNQYYFICFFPED
jgi:hypothetical protein